MLKKLPSRKGSTVEIENINTLLIDGNGLFLMGALGASNEFNSRGEAVGGVYQFLTMLRKLMNETVYHNIYVFWDGIYSGKLRYDIYPDYKSNRDKVYDGSGTRPQEEHLIIQRYQIKMYLEELFIKQIEDDVVESDDLIAQYCLDRKENEKITICTNDLDICQLINEDVRIYRCDKKIYIDHTTFKSFFGYDINNVAIIKAIVGDTSDCIYGVKGMGEKTLLKFFPYLTERKTNIIEILEDAEKIQLGRVKNKQKRLKSLDSLITGESLGKLSGSELFETNFKLVNLKEPIISEDTLNDLRTLIKNDLSDDRNFKNVIQLLKEHDILDKIGGNNLDNFLLTYKKYIERYKKTIL